MTKNNQINKKKEKLVIAIAPQREYYGQRWYEDLD